MMSVNTEIEKIIDAAVEGSVFFPRDFMDVGSSGAIRIALHRLVKRNILTRVAKGVYVKPYVSKLLNKEVLTDIEDIVKAIAKRDRARLLPSGSYALHVLGLSEQVPLNLVYYTDGKARKLKIGNTTVSFKKISPKKLAYKGKISRLVIQALSEIGKDKLLKAEERKILEILKNENILDLKHDIRLAPQWIGEILAKVLRK